MKKIILLCAFFICAAGGFSFAQENDPAHWTNITRSNMGQLFSDFFSSGCSHAQNEENLPAQKAKKKWQAVFFITSDNANWRYLNRLAETLEKEYQKGSLHRAVILYDRKVRKGEGFRENEDGVYLTVIGNAHGENSCQIPQKCALKDNSCDKKSRSSGSHESKPGQNFRIDPALNEHEKDISEILYLLLSGISKNTDTYNYFKIWAHGNGLNMKHYWQNSKGLTLDTVRDVIEKANLHIDVLELTSCMMGTVLNAQAILSSEKVDYLLFSSNLSVSPSFPTGNQFFNHFDLSPDKAAQITVDERVKQGRFIDTNNAMLISSKSIKTLNKFNRWLKKDYRKYPLDRFTLANDKSNKKQGNFSADSMLRDWSDKLACSLTDMMSDSSKYKLKENALSLRLALQKSIIKYRCWDASSASLYTRLEDVPKDSECMDGMTVNTQDFKSIWPS